MLTVCRGLQLFIVPRDSPMLYYLHPDVSFFKGNGFKAIGPYLDMPDNSAAGDVRSKPFVFCLSLDSSVCVDAGILFIQPSP